MQNHKLVLGLKDEKEKMHNVCVRMCVCACVRACVHTHMQLYKEWWFLHAGPSLNLTHLWHLTYLWSEIFLFKNIKNTMYLEASNTWDESTGK